MAITFFLLTGWLLSWFKFEQLFVQACAELFGKQLTVASYYFCFFVIGVIGDLVLLFQGSYGANLF
ncbi:MAG: hypothetical protein ACRDD4_05810 [Culicoidibacterales bacterium]